MRDFKDIDPEELDLMAMLFVPDGSLVAIPIAEGKKLGIGTDNMEWGIKSSRNEVHAFSGCCWGLDSDTKVFVVSDGFDPCFSTFISNCYKAED